VAPLSPQWFRDAGFTDIRLKRIGPEWYRGVRRHGLIMGCSVTARKPQAGPSPLQLGPAAEVSQKVNTNPLAWVLRLVLGSIGGEQQGRMAGCTALCSTLLKPESASFHAFRGGSRA
jgi:hypothetical protein